jgi:hypothetical protein
MEIFLPATLLKKVLFPTFGLPTNAIRGFAISIASLFLCFPLVLYTLSYHMQDFFPKKYRCPAGSGTTM